MKYIKEFEVIKFKLGMEKGLRRFNAYIPKNAINYDESLRSEKYPRYLERYDFDIDEYEIGYNITNWTPYILDHRNVMKTITSDECYIITDGQGHISVIEKEELEREYIASYKYRRYYIKTQK